jgi:phage-related protein
MKTSKLKPIVWIGTTIEDLRSSPKNVKDSIGYALYEAQKRIKPFKAKPMKGLSSVIEIKTDYLTDTYRTVYTVKLGERLYVLHVFKKKSKKGISTPKPDISLIKSRLKIAHELAKEEK